MTRSFVCQNQASSIKHAHLRGNLLASSDPLSPTPSTSSAMKKQEKRIGP